MSDRKAQAIYDAVNDVIMRFRVRVDTEREARTVVIVTDRDLAMLQHAAAARAVAAYKKPLHPKGGGQR